MSSNSDRIQKLEYDVRELRKLLHQQNEKISKYGEKPHSTYRERTRSKPTPKQWPTEQAIIRDLSNYDWKAWFFDRREEESQSDLATIVRDAIAGNTFRAFKKVRGRRPSETFRDWAIQALERGFRARFLKIRNQKEFNRWLADFVHDLQRYWTERMGKKMPFGPSFKLPNLLVKRMCLHNGVDDRAFKRIVAFLHVPLDSYTLQALARCYPGLGIPASATMRFIKEWRDYERCQSLIRKLAEKAKVPPIALDCLAWDEGHNLR